MKPQFFNACILIAILFSSCSKSTPQLPSNKIARVDSAREAMLTINQNLAEKEDSILRTLAARLSDKFHRNESGFWIKTEENKNGLKIRDKSRCKILYTVYDLNQQKIEASSKIATIGKKEIISGLEEGIKQMRSGDSATLIIPWYLAYGIRGNDDNIPAYTSLIYHVRVNTIN